ncbi:MAG: ribbon-helix-helix protein, CopG family [Oligoflexia bacterium]|nr:ribbon-helix-helix protein, CopG family [Oligoflexia bacterium]
MKTAISLPDELHEAADRLARRVGRSRSQLYADALREYLERHDEELVTARLDEVCAELDSSLEPALRRAGSRVLTREDW